MLIHDDTGKWLPQPPVASALRTESTKEELAITTNAMASSKVVGPNGLTVELLKLELQDKAILIELHWPAALIWREVKVPQHWKDGVITVLHKKVVKTKCGNYHGISLMFHPDEVRLVVVVRRHGYYYKAKGLLPEEQYRFRTDRSTTDMLFVVSRFQKIGIKAEVFNVIH